MKNFFLFILINVFLICNANAITLIEAIKEAYDNNPKLNAERENLKISKENNELYGSIKPKEISKNIESVDKIEIKPSQIDLSKEINKIGTYEAKINLHAEIQALIHIEVVKQEEKN